MISKSKNVKHKTAVFARWTGTKYSAASSGTGFWIRRADNRATAASAQEIQKTFDDSRSPAATFGRIRGSLVRIHEKR
jgi:hypothetical protein